MAIEVFASGNLSADPEQVKGYKGEVTYRITVSVNVIIDGENRCETQYYDVFCAGTFARRAEKLKKRDGVWFRGPMAIRNYEYGNEARRTHIVRCNELITNNETYEA